MIKTLSMAAGLIFAAQAAPDALPSANTSAAPITEFAQLPIEEATAARCGVVFAIIDGAQGAGVERALQWPNMKERGGQEFFVRALASLMEKRQLDRETVAALTQREVQLLSGNEFERAHELMPPCLLLLGASGG